MYSQVPVFLLMYTGMHYVAPLVVLDVGCVLFVSLVESFCEIE